MGQKLILGQVNRSQHRILEGVQRVTNTVSYMNIGKNVVEDAIVFVVDLIDRQDKT